jgi:hypothetical protein
MTWTNWPACIKLLKVPVSNQAVPLLRIPTFNAPFQIYFIYIRNFIFSTHLAIFLAISTTYHKYKPGTAKLDLGSKGFSIESALKSLSIHHTISFRIRNVIGKTTPLQVFLERNNSSILDQRKYYLPAPEQHCLFL